MTTNPLRIEVLYFEACPSWKQAVVILEKVLAELNIKRNISFIQVETQAEAEGQRFVGSPTIRVAGEDLFPTAQDHYALGCRLYQTPEGYRGWPTENMVFEKISHLGSGSESLQRGINRERT